MSERTLERRRPRGVTALALFFGFGAAMSALAMLSLATPGGALEPIWRMNPRAREQFGTMGAAGFLLLGVVCAACGVAASGLLRLRRWGWLVAVVLLAGSLAGDLANALSGLEPRAWFGVPVAALMLGYALSARVRANFPPRRGER